MRANLVNLNAVSSGFLKTFSMCLGLQQASFFSDFANLNSTESEIDLKKILFLGRLITETKMPPTVKGLFQCRVDDFFNSSLTSIGVPPSMCDALRKYDLFHFLQFWHRDSSFPTYTQ